MPTTTRRHTLTLAGLEVPVVEVAGAADGPRLVVLAGVHGCEYASMAAVRRWARGLEERELRGRVVAVPVLNLPASRPRPPSLVPDDGKNLNRCFPGDPAGTLADRLAYDAFTQLISGSDALVDAHTGDMVEALEPFALYDAGPAEARARDLATAYGLGYVIRQEPGPDRAVGGTSSAAAAGLGIPAIIAEAGQCGLVEPAAVAKHVRGLNRVLAQLGMAEAGAPAAAGLAGARPPRRGRAGPGPPAPVPVAALRGRGLLGPGRRGRRGRGRRAAAGHGQHAGRGAGPSGDHRARRRGAHVHHQLTGRGRGRPAAGAG